MYEEIKVGVGKSKPKISAEKSSMSTTNTPEHHRLTKQVPSQLRHSTKHLPTHLPNPQQPYSLLKSITTRPATSPLFNCCTLSANRPNPLTSQILCSSPLLAYSKHAAASCIEPTMLPVRLSLRKQSSAGGAPSTTLASLGGRPMHMMVPPVREPM